jgi:hypothetical protein
MAGKYKNGYHRVFCKNGNELIQFLGQLFDFVAGRRAFMVGTLSTVG